jgi:hypothetical protein
MLYEDKFEEILIVSVAGEDKGASRQRPRKRHQNRFI